jgi:endonuclease YncB( thermonuclease family)
MTRQKNNYLEIIQEISEIYEQGRDGSIESGNKHTLYANWKIGGQIRQGEQGGQDRADYGTQLLDKLARDLNKKYGRGFSKSNLANMRKFNELYQLREISSALTWSHYRTLITVEDANKRKNYQQQCIKDGLSQRQLYDLLRNNSSQKRKIKRPIGKPGTYRITHKPELGKSRPQIHFDLGFGVYADFLFELLPEARRLNVFRVQDHSGKYEIIEKETPSSNLYLYPAIVERVVDGDTIILQAELGFGIRARERFRLRGINLPEKSSATGRKLAALVKRKLRQSPRVVIRTYGTGVHGRYVADVLFSPGVSNTDQIIEKGRFLNQELLDAGYGE